MIIESLNEVNLTRNDIYITLKIWTKNRNQSELIQTTKFLIDTMNLQYADLILLSDPIDSHSYFDLWKAVEILKEEGITKSIGVSKITVTLLLDLIRNCSIPPAVFLTEINPFNCSKDLISFCEDNSIVIVSNDPFSKKMRTYDDSILLLNKNSGDEITIKWALTQGFAVLLAPSKISVNLNFEVLEEALSSSLIDSLTSINERFDTQWIPTVVKTSDEL